MTQDNLENGDAAKAKEAALLADEGFRDVKPTPLFGSWRLVLAFIGFFMFFHLYAQRVGMSVAIVSMVNQTAVRQLQSEQDSVNGTVVLKPVREPPEQCRAGNASITQPDGPFVWPKEIQGHIMGSFFYGYLVSQIPGGLLAERFGAKWIIAGFLSLSTVATLLTPIASYVSVGFLIVLRVLCGIGSGALFPAMHAMLGQWAPPLERSKLCGLTYAGTFMGNVITMPVSGLLCQYGFSEGWDSVFYVFGITSVITIVLWCILTSNTPSDHPRISKEERDYIVGSLRGQFSHKQPSLCEMPWREIWTSGPVWALIIANFCVDWGLYTYLTNIPSFYSEVLFFDIQSNGALSALPFLGLWASMTICPLIADKLRESRKIGTAATRKLFNSVGMFGAGLVLVGLGFLDCTKTILAVILLILAVTLSGCVYSGYFVNHMDIAPQYAGTLMGIANGLAASSGFIAPYVAAVITKDQTQEQWQIVFFIAAAVYAFGGILFIILARGTIQPWARDILEPANSPTMNELIIVESNHDEKANGIHESSANDARRSPIYKPKSASNGELAAEPMLTKEV